LHTECGHNKTFFQNNNNSGSKSYNYCRPQNITRSVHKFAGKIVGPVPGGYTLNMPSARKKPRYFRQVPAVAEHTHNKE
jgi:hypothetical protein